MQDTIFNEDELEKSSEQKDKISEMDKFQNIVLTSNVVQDEYTEYIADKFDLHVSDTCTVLIPNKLNLSHLKENWKIGVICGGSGSGKSTILKSLCKQITGKDDLKYPVFDNTKPLISNFDNMSPQDATLLLSQMGLACVPTWIRPYNVLSNGEQYRAQLAKLVADEQDGEIIFIDEYTSVVDRNVAMAMSNSLQKYVRRNNKRIIVATCHYDVFDWLRPDWIYDLNKGGALSQGDYLRQPRPKIELQVFRTTCDTWEHFKKYHYMTSELNKACYCFVFTWNNKLVAFYSILPLPSGSYQNAYRGHRLVVLPDFQGLGIGSHVSEFIGGILKNNGKNFHTKTVNPALGIYRENSHKWVGTSKNGHAEKEERTAKSYNIMGGLTRPSYCHKYVGEPIEGYDDLLLTADKIRHRNAVEHIFTLDFGDL